MKQEVQLIIKENKPREYAHLIRDGIDPFIARLLHQRGIVDLEEAKRYLHGSVSDLHSPALIKNIKEACRVISDAIINDEHIFVFGDYDVDGVTSTAIMVLTLKELGANVDYRLPDRLTEGYGMSIKAVEELAQRGCDLVITVDNGIKCHAEIDRARELGMKVVVLDHHVAADELPSAEVVVDLHVEGETYPFVELAGCGLAFKVSCYLYEQFGFEDEGMKNIDLAAIGTVADVVPLEGENRIIVRLGVEAISANDYGRTGIIELLKCFNVEKSRLTSMDIGFKIGPALNAPGRLLERGAEQALSLLLAENAADAEIIALELFGVNETRKQITQDSMDRAEQYLEEKGLLNDKVLVLFVEGVPEGVVGLVSGKLTEKYHRPSLVFTEGHQYFKASGRSTPVFNLYNALCSCDDLFVRYGGHAQAAGMTIEKDHSVLDELRRRINEYADKVLTAEDLVKKIYVDDVIELDDVSFEMTDLLDAMEPFGQCNPKPVFMVKNFLTARKQKNGEYSHFARMGVRENHLKIYGEAADAIGFDMVEQFEELGQPIRLQIVFTLGINFFRGRENLQLEMIHFSMVNDAKPQKTELMNQLGASIAALNGLSAAN